MLRACYWGCVGCDPENGCTGAFEQALTLRPHASYPDPLQVLYRLNLAERLKAPWRRPGKRPDPVQVGSEGMAVGPEVGLALRHKRVNAGGTR